VPKFEKALTKKIKFLILLQLIFSGS